MENFPTAERQHAAPQPPRETLFDDDFITDASKRAQDALHNNYALDSSQSSEGAPIEDDVIGRYDQQIEKLAVIAETLVDKLGIGFEEAMDRVDETNIRGKRQAELQARAIESEKQLDKERATTAAVFIEGFGEEKLLKAEEEIRTRLAHRPDEMQREINELRARARVKYERRGRRS